MPMKSWNQLSQTQRVNLSVHTKQPILEELNPVYGYYATIKTLTQAEYRGLLRAPTYTGPVHPAEQRRLDNPTCG